MDGRNAARDWAALVRQAMTDQGKSITELAKESLVPYTTLHRKLNRPDKYPFDVEELPRIAAALGTTAAALFARMEEGEDAA